MNIAICEDLERDARQLAELLARYRERNGVEFDVTTFRNGDELMRGYEPGRFQILFLDIYMDGVNGMEAAKRIRVADDGCELIFTTVSREHAMEGFAVRAAHYLSKPLEYEQIEEAMGRCREQVNRHARSIGLTVGSRPVRVRLRDILYVEVFGKSCMLHTVNGDMDTKLPIDELEQMLGGSPFLRCHRSYIVNLNHVRDVVEHRFILTNGDHALIPIRNYAAMKKAFHEHNFSRMGIAL